MTVSKFFSTLEQGWKVMLVVGSASAVVFGAGAASSGILKIPVRVNRLEQHADSESIFLRESRRLERAALCLIVAEHNRSDREWSHCLLEFPETSQP